VKKPRYHVMSGEPNHPSTDEREWDVLDRWKTHGDCQDCPGECVATLTTRKAAREECARLNHAAEVLSRGLTVTKPTNPQHNPNNDEGHTP